MKSKFASASNARERAKALGLAPAGAVEMEVRSCLDDKIIAVVGQVGLTHAQAVKLCSASRSRMTAILNRNTQGASTDLLLRILARLGYRAKVTFSKAA
jgi:predicted XRE-type DNA-binding protein